MEPSQGIQQDHPDLQNKHSEDIQYCRDFTLQGENWKCKPKNLTLKWSGIILNNIIHKVSDFAFGKNQSSVILFPFYVLQV